MRSILTINTYGGSLLLAARACGSPVIASLEDTGYGVKVQRANFPDLRIVPALPWSPVDLRGALVLAHPPCAPFSVMSTGRHKQKGVDAKKFECTVRAMSYAMSNGCDALAVESVPGALEGARAAHDSVAREHGYDLYRVPVNSADFGVPQRRLRFWALFVKRGLLATSTLWLPFNPVREETGCFLTPGPTVLHKDNEKIMRQRNMLVAEGLDPDRVLCDPEGGKVHRVISRLWPERHIPSGHAMHQRYCVDKTWDIACLRVLSRTRPTEVLMQGSYWSVDGRALTLEEYQAIMGFPQDYRFPMAPRSALAFLSRGVCPPVAAQVIRWLEANLNHEVDKGVEVKPGGVADLTQETEA